MTCSKSTATELELYYQITLMCKCCWHWKNQCLVNNNVGNRNNDLFKVSQHTVNTKETGRWHMTYWHETNQYPVSKHGREQIIGTVACSKSTSNALGLHKKDNTNGMCCWRGTNLYPVSKQCRKRNNWNNDPFKVHSKCIETMQTKWHRWCMLMTLGRSLYSGSICND